MTADGSKFIHPLQVVGKTINDLPLVAADTFKHMFLFRKFTNIQKVGKFETFITNLLNGVLPFFFPFSSLLVNAARKAALRVPQRP